MTKNDENCATTETRKTNSNANLLHWIRIQILSGRTKIYSMCDQFEIIEKQKFTENALFSLINRAAINFVDDHNDQYPKNSHAHTHKWDEII